MVEFEIFVSVKQKWKYNFLIIEAYVPNNYLNCYNLIQIYFIIIYRFLHQQLIYYFQADNNLFHMFSFYYNY